MIEITRSGSLPQQRRYHAVCPTCGTEFTFLRTDAFASAHNGGVTLKCPLPGCVRVIVHYCND